MTDFDPGVPAGVTALTVAESITWTFVAATPPTVTPEAPLRFEPVKVICVIPLVGPPVGDTATRLAAGATYVKPLTKLNVPWSVLTATVLDPSVPAGVRALTVVGLSLKKPVAATPPTVTPVAEDRLLPVTTMSVPPEVGPELGVTEVSGGSAYVKALLREYEPSGVETNTDVVPGEPGGVIAVTVVGLTTVMFVAATPPNETVVAPVRFVPVKVTRVPPVVGPEAGDTAVIVGVGWTYVNALPRLAAPFAVWMETVFAPVVFAGLTAVTVVELTVWMFVAATPPNVTAVVPTRFVPVSVTVVPPVVGPELGETAVRVAAPS